MADNFAAEPMLALFIFDMLQLTEQLEQSIDKSEKINKIQPFVNEIFRIVHLINGLEKMMLFICITILANSLKVIFYYVSENNPKNQRIKKLYKHIFALPYLMA